MMVCSTIFLIYSSLIRLCRRHKLEDAPRRSEKDFRRDQTYWYDMLGYVYEVALVEILT